MMTQTDIRSLKEIITDSLESKSLTPQRLAELTDIPERYIVAICEGKCRELPPAPYVRGYLGMIGGFLSLDGQALWRLYREEFPVRTSGTADTLPANRFAQKSSSGKQIFLVAAVIGILIAAWRLPAFIGKPVITIADIGNSSVVVHTPTIKLTGTVDPGDTLSINNQPVAVASDGRFEKDWSLDQGVNGLQFTAKRFLGRETTVEKQIIYQPQ